MKTFFHSDADGKASAAIVYNFFNRDMKMLPLSAQSYIPINYNQEFPFESITPYEEVIIVDFSLKEDEFRKLLKITDNVVWIDHHKTAIERFKNFDIDIKGIRRDGVSGCELTWEHYYGGKTVPKIISLLGDYDTWKFKYGDETNKLQTGLRLYDTRPEVYSWKKWLEDDTSLDTIIKDGSIVLKYRRNMFRSLVKSWSYWTEFEGHKAIVCNAGSVSSQLFDTVRAPYDIMIAWVFDGTNYVVSLYTKSKDIDVSEIAKKYDGGGHRGAAGFTCSKLPFSGGERYFVR